MIKNYLKTIGIVAIGLTIATVSNIKCNMPSYGKTVHYTSNCIVSDATETGCLLLDSYGNTWYYEFENATYTQHELVTVTFDTMNTNAIHDDEIISIRKEGK